MTARMPTPMQLDQWPSTDQSAWERAISADPLAAGGGGGGANWRSSTRHFVQIAYGRWLAWLQEEGRLNSALAIWERADGETVRGYLDAMTLGGLADYTVAGALQGLGDAIRVMCPGVDKRFIGRAAGRISAGAKRARDPATKLKDPAEVLGFARSLMDCAEGNSLPPLRRSIAFRDGLLLAYWTLRAPRVANLAQIRIGRNLRPTSRGHRLEFEADEMKGRRPWGFAWPPILEESLSIYLREHRPILVGAEDGSDGALWVSQFGKPMPPASVAQVIKLRTKAHFGVALSSHQMRYIAATYIAESRPSDRADVAAILGHKSLRVADNHYILAEGFTATAMYQDAVLRRPRGGKQ